MQSEENLAWLWNLMIKALEMHVRGAQESLVLWKANDGVHVRLKGLYWKALYSIDYRKIQQNMFKVLDHSYLSLHEVITITDFQT